MVVITYTKAVVITVILVVIIAAVLWGPLFLRREIPTTQDGFREKYGPPPGAQRAMGHKERDQYNPGGFGCDGCGCKGWDGWIGWAGSTYPEYEGNTASSMSQFIMRSA
jgi:hypothetical protein